jgi:pimeloyl-ACP methyl ester carboxylesterase
MKRAPACRSYLARAAAWPADRLEVGDETGEVVPTATFALIHGGGDVGWYWHLVERELHNSAGPQEYADAVVRAIDTIADRRPLVIVGQSYGGFTAPLVAERLGADLLVLVAAMIPAPGEAPADWWDNTGYRHAAQEQALRDGGLTGSDDPFVAFYHDVPRALAQEALGKTRETESETAYNTPWPLTAWPQVPTRFVLCTQDRFFPAGFVRRVVAERLGVIPDEITAGHCVALSRPSELAELLAGYASARASA